MIKKSLPALFTLALIVLGVLYYLKQSVPQTTENDSWQSFVPANVGSILQINTIKLRDLMISEGFKSPRKLKSLYDDLDSMKTKIKLPSKEVGLLIKEGLLLPDQFVAFEIIDGKGSILCSIFPVKKSNTFNKLFKERSYKELSKNLFYLEDKKFGVSLVGNKCLLFYGAEMSEDDFKNTFDIILQQQKSFKSEQISKSMPEFSLAINKGSMLHPEYSPLRNFNIEILGSHQSGTSLIDLKIHQNENLPPFLTPVKNHFPKENQESAIASLALNLNLEDYPLKKLLSEKQNRDVNKSLKVIQGDLNDLDVIWDGEISFLLKKPFIKEGKFTSYSYNDNFEKVEGIQTKVDTLPDFEMFFTLKNNGNQKLQEKSWVQNNEFVAYPLQKVYYRSKRSLAHLTPQKSSSPNLFEQKKDIEPRDNESFNLNIDINALTDHYPYLFEEYERALYDKHLKNVSIDEVDDMSYQLKILYANETQHGLISLLELVNDHQKMAQNTDERSLEEELP